MPLRILAVDDEAEILRLLKSMVEPWGYEITALTDSQEAARRLETEKFDGIVLDALMPPPDGFELARRARNSPLNGEAPVVMVTGLNDVETMRKCFAIGVTFFLSKPFSSDRAYNLFNASRGAMLRERRRHTRLPFRTAVQCRFGEHGEKHFRADSLDLSESGMLLEPSGGLDLGQEVTLEFKLPAALVAQDPKLRKSISAKPSTPESGPRSVRAKVVCKTPPDRLVVRFVSLTPEDRRLIERFISGRADS